MTKKGIKWFVALLVIVVVGSIGTRKWLKDRKPHVVYENANVLRGDIQVTILATGSVAPENRLDLKPPVAGRVEKVLVQEGDHVRAGQILALVSSTERATLIDTAKAVGKDELKYWEDAYKMTPILAPTKGLIILKSADAGQTVLGTDIILSMSDRLIVKTNVDETDLAQIQNLQTVQVILDAYPSDQLPGKVTHIGYDAKTVNNVTTYEVDVAVNKPPEFMKSGMTANVTFLVAEKDNVLTVPAAAVHRKGKHSFVLQPNPENNNQPLETPVEVGLSDGKKIEITSGIQEDDPIFLASLSSLNKNERSSNPLTQMNSHGGGGGGRH